MHEIVITKLKRLKAENNFSNEVWNKKGLVISSQDTCSNLKDDYKLLLDVTIEYLSDHTTQAKLKNLLGKKLRSINKNQYDSEEKELFLYKVMELAEIVNVDLKFEANRWLYGYIIAKIFRVYPEIAYSLRFS